MAIRVKDTASLAAKFKTRASAASGDYKTGVETAGQDWQAKTAASEDNYKQAVIEAANAGRFGKGVSAAGAARYMKRASELGPSRFATGVAAAQDDWARGATPYLDAIRNLDLPPRRPKGSPENMQRASAVAMKLRAMKVGS